VPDHTSADILCFYVMYMCSVQTNEMWWHAECTHVYVTCY